jgi:tetratricopeptide (TPR) repeat protein
MSLRALAKAVPCDPTYLSRALRGIQPFGPKLARDVDNALQAGGEIVRAAAGSERRTGSVRASVAEAAEVMSWVTATSASDDVIGELARNAEYLAGAHARMPAAKVLNEVLSGHRAVRAVLRGGRQRLAQTRILLRTDSALLAHACLLLGDLGQYETARAYGSAALLCAQEAEADEGPAWTAMAKTARWQDSFTESAGLAARGFGASARTPVRAELAYREANAFALLGDTRRAREALAKAMEVSDGLDDDGTSAWSFSRGRQAIFTVSVCVHTGDPDGALRAVEEADAYWDAGGGKVTATWAQVRAGAAMAHLLKNSLDDAAGQLQPVLALSPDQRIRTVTGYLDQISGMIRAPRFAGSPLAAQLGEQITKFNAGAAASTGA